jgi:hypothetical protein
MVGCLVCEHPKHDAIMAHLARGRPVGLAAYYFRIDKMALVRHCQHAPIPRTIEPINDCGDSTEITIPTPVLPQAAKPHVKIYAEYDVSTAESEEPSCVCAWCQLTPYRRLKRAWEETTDLDHGRLSIEIAPFDVPF